MIIKRDDALWKAILEDLFDDFLLFFFSKDYQNFDIDKGFVYLDKELQKLFPQDKDLYHPKYVDKLVKIFMKDGSEQWFLIHIEVQGYEDKTFEHRMFTYYYRIHDRYQKDITALAIFADDKVKYHPKFYEKSFLGTKIVYHFNTYKILEQADEVINSSENPFAIVIQTVKTALKEKKNRPEQLFDLKLDLVRNLLKKEIPKTKIDALMNFIRKYVRLGNEELETKFQEKIEQLTNESLTNMGIKEFILEREKLVARQERRKTRSFL